MHWITCESEAAVPQQGSRAAGTSHIFLCVELALPQRDWQGCLVYAVPAY